MDQDYYVKHNFHWDVLMPIALTNDYEIYIQLVDLLIQLMIDEIVNDHVMMIIIMNTVLNQI